MRIVRIKLFHNLEIGNEKFGTLEPWKPWNLIQESEKATNRNYLKSFIIIISCNLLEC